MSREQTDSSGVPTVDAPGGRGDALAGPARAALERDVLPGFLRAQRWFGGKARTVEAVRVADSGRLPTEGDAPAYLLLLEVTYAGGGRDLYFVPLGVAAGSIAESITASGRPDVVARLREPGGDALLHDALADDAVCEALLKAIGDGTEFATEHGIARGVPTAAFGRLRGEPDDPLPPERAPATSSNSLVFYGERLLLKLFRRLEPGVNPDYEVGRFLTESGRFDRLPQVAGALEYRRGGEAYTAGILQTRVANQGDGWGHALGELAAYYSCATADAPASPNPRPLTELAAQTPPPAVRNAIGDYLSAAAVLGRRTGEMHLALASDRSDPAFAPEPITDADMRALTGEIVAQGKRALDALAANVDRLPPEVSGPARGLLDRRAAILDRLAAGPDGVPDAAKTRVHGDYHLGQVLWVGGDYIILDFEGEPTRTVEERRGKFSPVRDVAGMLRSYHYAAYAGLFAHAKDRPNDFDRLRPWADLWFQWVSAAFLRAYLGAAGDAAFVPRKPEEFAALLDGFTLAKALYELVYELNNRPDWVRIPLGGVLGLVGRTG